MRITTNTMMRNFQVRFNKQQQQINRAMERAESGRKFSRTSEDTTGAARARALYREYQNNEIYTESILSAQKMFDTAQASLLSISGRLEDVYAAVVDANGVKNEDNRKIIAQQLRSLQEQLVMDANAKFNTKHMYGGADVGTPPFSLDPDGTVRFRGLDVSDPANYADLQKMAGEHAYIDIGFGIQFQDLPGGYNTVVNGTGFDTAMSGLNFFGFGIDAGTGLPNNVFDLIGKLADELESPTFDADELEKISNQFDKGRKNLLLNLTAVDTNAAYLEFSLDRLEASQLNIQERIDEVANIDKALAYTLFEMELTQYQAALKLGASILTVSFLDFIT